MQQNVCKNVHHDSLIALALTPPLRHQHAPAVLSLLHVVHVPSGHTV